jgi:tetratricopeptide (TPR) repeat protein
VPQVRQRFPNLPKPTDSQGETARIRLTEAFLELLTAIAEEHPVILVVDDLHFADDVSLAVLHLVMRRARGQPIMVAFLARTGEISQSAHAIGIRENASSLGIGEIELAPLSDTESREMLRSLIEADEPQPGVPEQRAILRAAAGFPMVLELLVQDWKASTDQCLAFAVDAMTLDLRIRESTGSAYIRILDRLTRSLDHITQNVLNVAAVLGHRLNDLSMYGIVDLSAGQTIVGMTELVARRVLRDGPRGLEFANEFVRAAAYIGVTPSLRQVLHGEIAERLIPTYWAGSDDLGLEIAWHCMRGGRSKEATGYLLNGARRAKRADALHEGETALSSALLQSHLTNPERAEAVLLLSEILQEQGRWADSLQLLETEMQRDLSLDSTWVRILSLTARFHIYGRTPPETVEDIQFLNEVIKSAGENPLRIAAADLTATLVGMLRDEVRARQSLEAIGSISLAELTPSELSKLSLAKARLAFHLHDKDATLRQIEIALPQIDSTQELSATAAQLRSGLGSLSCMDGQYLNAVRHLERARGIAVRLGNDTLMAWFSANLALAYGRLGNYERQLHYSEESLSVRPAQVLDYNELLATYCGAIANIFLGLDSKARHLISRGRLRNTESLAPWALQAWNLYSADVHLLLGEELEANRIGLFWTTGSNSEPHGLNFVGIFCRWKARLATTDQDIEAATATTKPFLDDLTRHDALDRAEILASMALLMKKRGRTSSEIDALLRKQLEALPSAVAHQLQRLGICSFPEIVNSMPVSSKVLTLAK